VGILESMSAADATGDGARTVTLRIPAKAEYITLCRLALTGLGQLREIGDDTMADLKLALTEAVSNSVRHAYGPNGDGSVDVTYELRPDRLGIEIVDDGEGFDPDAPADETTAPDRDGDDLTEGGLGIAIIKSIADEFELRSKPGERGSTLRFVKNLS
jgi:serine/threonine-protein kinase RsbW